MLNVTIPSFVVGLCLVVSVQAQPDSLWSRTYGGENWEECTSHAQTADSGFILAGYTSSFGAGSTDFWLVRTDESGESLWSRTYGGIDDDRCYVVIMTNDGGFAMAGSTASLGSGQTDFWLIKTDENGDSLWSKSYGGSGQESCSALIEIENGGFILAGSSNSFGSGDKDIWVVWTNENGDSLLALPYGGDSREFCSSIIRTTDGGFALAGTTQSFGASDINFWLLRINSNGDSLWSQSFDKRGRDICKSLIQTTDNGFALAGFTQSIGNVNNDFWLIRTSESGDSLWSRTFGSGGYEGCNSIITSLNNGFVLSGLTTLNHWPNEDYLIIRVDENGDSLWSLTFGGRDDDVSSNIIQTYEGGFALAGYSESFGAGGRDFWLVKTTPDPVSVSNDPFISYPLSFSLMEPFPNPFNSSLSISFRTSRPGLYALDVVDPTGRRLGVISEGFLPAGERRVVWDVAGTAALPAGTYYLRLADARGGMDIRPIVLMK